MIKIDVPADLNFEDDEGYVLARVPNSGAQAPGTVLVAGTAYLWTWARVVDVESGWMRLKAVDVAEALRHGQLVAS